MRAKWRKKRVRRLKRKRRKTRARSKQLTTTRSRSLLPIELYRHLPHQRLRLFQHTKSHAQFGTTIQYNGSWMFKDRTV
ncbi:hypothetical protein L207DRAFT_293375 [Hyaloscypha variabilis F]|uniref:60S ribosomal protein L41 n=1 Tax=Hyaloscypha variabilis (strain UAMH 11265 / GT02V1 / F) TaxID=1149755 RepID=A0A2J6RXS2_HYAVF|nr:hypothetical protein L207DRAFT_293375 [Hyaloscypha variabilis F]